MGKRSNFERRERDFYPTPLEAVEPLLEHLAPHTIFHEPCAGDGALVDHLQAAHHACVWASDIEPQTRGIVKGDALEATIGEAEVFITNPPWERSILHKIIVALSDQAPTWLLFDADWIHTRQSAPYIHRLVKIVSVGRVKWIPDSKMTGKDNCCWYLFDGRYNGLPTFFGRN